MSGHSDSWKVKIKRGFLFLLCNYKIYYPGLIRCLIGLYDDWTTKAEDRAGDNEACRRCRQVLFEKNAGKCFRLYLSFNLCNQKSFWPAINNKVPSRPTFSQMDMHLCAAKCCDDRSSSIETVQRCVQNCSTGVTKAERYVHHQMQDFQNRLQRCVMVREEQLMLLIAWRLTSSTSLTSNAMTTLRESCPQTPRTQRLTNIPASSSAARSSALISTLILFQTSWRPSSQCCRRAPTRSRMFENGGLKLCV